MRWCGIPENHPEIGKGIGCLENHINSPFGHDNHYTTIERVSIKSPLPKKKDSGKKRGEDENFSGHITSFQNMFYIFFSS